MIIRDMFADDINRNINGVIKVNQDDADVVEQEVREYVITRELKKHFITFFNNYVDAFDTPTADIGVWESGFFGSGKSLLLKIQSYILENRKIGDTTTVEIFREKFKDDPATFMLIDRATKCKAETILFNIDIEGSIYKDKTAVLRVFAKVFFDHLGFYGRDLKIARLEAYIDQEGKTEEFRRVFEQKKGKPWLEVRQAYSFNGNSIIPTLMEVLDMSEEDAKAWFHDKTSSDYSIEQLVEDIKAYVDSKPSDFRLLFMVDEVGQYVGTSTDMLLNLQSIVEELGSRCNSKVWVICTGQEALDQIILNMREDAFSKIQARFKTRLSLSSSSVDEVIQKRLLKKTLSANKLLESVYDKNDPVMRNLFSFSNSALDIGGYNGPSEFTENFPFVPYQYIVMQNVLNQIRTHGNSGKNMSSGERSMLECFQIAAQKVQRKDEYAIAPFYLFYEALHSFLDSSIRRVIDRCQRAADNSAGIEQYDVNVLKLLYLIRYVDDAPATVENIMILMADDIRADKIKLRTNVQASLDRLLRQNYIGRNGDKYNFLTDPEQDVQREIRNTPVDTAAIVERIAQMIFADLYQTKKYHYDKYDFPFDQMVDGVTVGAVTGGMRLRILTVATDEEEKSELRLMAGSEGQAIVVLGGESRYYDTLESAMKIRKYVKQRNVQQLPESVQSIIRGQSAEAAKYEQEAKEELQQAIVSARFYVDGEHLDIRSGDAKSKLDQALEYLVVHVYNKLELLNKNVDSDADIRDILSGAQPPIAGAEPNRDAAADVEDYLRMQNMKHLPTSMADVQSRYQAIPYGWKEIDIAAVVAMLIAQQKVTIKYAGATIRANNPKLPDMLRKKSEIGKTSISIHIAPPEYKMKAVRKFMRDYFDLMDVPDDEDGLVTFIVTKFTDQRAHYMELKARYDRNSYYPDKSVVNEAIQLVNGVISQQKDNDALINRVIKDSEALLDSKEDMQNVESFFKTQVQVFDAAFKMQADLQVDNDYLRQVEDAYNAMNRIRLLVVAQTSKFNYKCIPELNTLMQTVRNGHNSLLGKKREELNEIIRQCREAIHSAADGDPRVKDIVVKADRYYDAKKAEIDAGKTLNYLDGLMVPMAETKDNAVTSIEDALKPVVVPTPPVDHGNNGTAKPVVKKSYKNIYRQVAFPTKTLETEADIDEYLAQRKKYMLQQLSNCDGIKIQ